MEMMRLHVRVNAFVPRAAYQSTALHVFKIPFKLIVKKWVDEGKHPSCSTLQQTGLEESASLVARARIICVFFDDVGQDDFPNLLVI